LLLAENVIKLHGNTFCFERGKMTLTARLKAIRTKNSRSETAEEREEKRLNRIIEAHKIREEREFLNYLIHRTAPWG
jgi:hypothetical protein